MECELCNRPARMYCESDQASLCWDCDAKVHGANFLVARHSRCLLCQNCQSPTPWKASGAKLGPTVSVCEGCLTGCNGRGEVGEHEDREVGYEEDDGGEEEEDEEEEDDDDNEEEEGDNQVVPWSSSTPPPVASSSSSEGSTVRLASSMKRMREEADLCSQDDMDSSSFPQLYSAVAGGEDEEEATSVGSVGHENRILPLSESGPGQMTQSRSEPLCAEPSGTFQKAREYSGEKKGSPAANVIDIPKLSKRARRVDLI